MRQSTRQEGATRSIALFVLVAALIAAVVGIATSDSTSDRAPRSDPDAATVDAAADPIRGARGEAPRPGPEAARVPASAARYIEVVDLEGAPVAGVRVVVRGPRGHHALAGPTDTDGRLQVDPQAIQEGAIAFIDEPGLGHVRCAVWGTDPVARLTLPPTGSLAFAPDADEHAATLPWVSLEFGRLEIARMGGRALDAPTQWRRESLASPTIEFSFVGLGTRFRATTFLGGDRRVDVAGPTRLGERIVVRFADPARGPRLVARLRRVDDAPVPSGDRAIGLTLRTGEGEQLVRIPAAVDARLDWPVPRGLAGTRVEGGRVEVFDGDDRSVGVAALPAMTLAATGPTDLGVVVLAAPPVLVAGTIEGLPAGTTAHLIVRAGADASAQIVARAGVEGDRFVIHGVARPGELTLHADAEAVALPAPLRFVAGASDVHLRFAVSRPLRVDARLAASAAHCHATRHLTACAVSLSNAAATVIPGFALAARARQPETTAIFHWPSLTPGRYRIEIGLPYLATPLDTFVVEVEPGGNAMQLDRDLQTTVRGGRLTFDGVERKRGRAEFHVNHAEVGEGATTRTIDLQGNVLALPVPAEGVPVRVHLGGRRAVDHRLMPGDVRMPVSETVDRSVTLTFDPPVQRGSVQVGRTIADVVDGAPTVIRIANAGRHAVGLHVDEHPSSTVECTPSEVVVGDQPVHVTIRWRVQR